MKDWVTDAFRGNVTFELNFAIYSMTKKGHQKF